MALWRHPIQRIFLGNCPKNRIFDKIQKIKENYSDEEKFKDMEADKKLRQLAQKECDCVGDDRVSRRENRKG